MKISKMFCKRLLPDERNHYHDDTSNYNIIRALLQVPVAHEVFQHLAPTWVKCRH